MGRYNNVFKELAKRKGIKILTLKKKNWVACLLNVNKYIATVKYKNKTLEINVWAGLETPSMDSIYFSIIDQINKMEEAIQFEAYIKEVNNGK